MRPASEARVQTAVRPLISRSAAALAPEVRIRPSNIACSTCSADSALRMSLVASKMLA